MSKSINSHLQIADLGNVCRAWNGMCWAGSNPLRQETQLGEVNGKNQMVVNTIFHCGGQARAAEQNILIFQLSSYQLWSWEELLKDSCPQT